METVYISRLRRFTDGLDKYDWLMQLYDRNKDAFFRLLGKYAEELVPIVYTPTVGDACENLPLVYRSGRGLYVTLRDEGNIKNILKNWLSKDIKAICVTDGERILGLGDLGTNGMGIPVGKLSLYTALAGIPPNHLLPVTLDVGTNNEKLLKDPLYFGSKTQRIRGEEYDDFVDEFMRASTEVFGKDVLIQFEDFANQNAFRLIKKYEKSYTTFNDDIQGTASVMLAGLLASGKLTKRSLVEEVVLCFGAGEAALGFSNLFSEALKRRAGLSPEEAKKHLYLIDSKGLVVVGRKTGGLTEHKLVFAQPAGTPEMTGMEEIIKYTKCTALLGAAGVAGTFTASVLKQMAAQNERPLIMALSNPSRLAECTAEEAYRNTEGRCVFASGSPYGSVSLDKASCPGLKTDKLDLVPSQANNMYIFPGLALGIITGQIHPVTDDDFIKASETLASLVEEDEFSKGSIFPSLKRIRQVSSKIASQVILSAAAQGRSHLSVEGEAAGSKLSASQVDRVIAAYADYPPRI